MGERIMALTIQQQFDLANEATFRNRVGMAMAGVAFDVMAENQAATTGTDYNGVTEASARTNLAVQVIRDTKGSAERLKWTLAAAAGDLLTWNGGQTAAVFAASIADAGYLSFIAANWSTLAGWRESDIVSP